MAVCALRYVQVFVRAGEADVMKHEVVEVAYEGARQPGRRVGAEGQAAKGIMACSVKHIQQQE